MTTRKNRKCSKNKTLTCKSCVNKFGYYKSCRAKKYQNVYGRSDSGIRSPVGIFY